MSDTPIHVMKLWSAEAITKNTSATSAAIDLDKFRVNGLFSLQVELTGDGTGKFEYLLSNNEADFLEPSSAVDIAAGFLKTSGPGGDGKDIFSFHPEYTRFMKIKATETGNANDIAVSAWLALG